MDIKTLSAIIGHVSSATTIDIYSYITDAMQTQAANKIKQGIGRGEAFAPPQGRLRENVRRAGKPAAESEK